MNELENILDAYVQNSKRFVKALEAFDEEEEGEQTNE